MILDVCFGSGGFYHKRHLRLRENFVSIDIRKGDFTYKTPKAWSPTRVIIKPLILADMQFLPFKNATFNLIVFDPPHTDAGLDTFLGKSYGSWNQKERIRTCRKANLEFQRVLKPHGIIILKVLPRQFPIYETLLKNFAFFLPIYTYRLRGSYTQDKGKNLGAVWFLGQLKE
ncbi:MAG: hypothetical protein KAW52_07100 [candidate division Zixibacteria bacterium]|nr:hypothetical protein [candidate division Zixibacteria bacterium]